MARYKQIATLLVLPFALAQCASGSGRETAKGANDEREEYEFAMTPASRVETTQERSEAEAKARRLTMGQVGMASDAAHNAAIDQARITFTKTKNPEVKSFAQMMLADHGKAKQTETALIVEMRANPEESELATEFGVESGRVLFALREAAPGDVDREYMKAQVAFHERLLRALDEQLIPNAGDSRLEEALRAFRERVKMHLETAREIAQELDGETETKGSVPGPSPSLP